MLTNFSTNIFKELKPNREYKSDAYIKIIDYGGMKIVMSKLSQNIVKGEFELGVKRK